MFHGDYLPAHVLAQRLELAATRNAQLLVVLRHLIAHLHVTQNGHNLSAPWTECGHERCQSVQRLVGR
jgi:hypothetical protein